MFCGTPISTRPVTLFPATTLYRALPHRTHPARRLALCHRRRHQRDPAHADRARVVRRQQLTPSPPALALAPFSAGLASPCTALERVPALRRGAVCGSAEIGRAHVCTPVTNAHLVCRLLLEKKKESTQHIH